MSPSFRNEPRFIPLPEPGGEIVLKSGETVPESGWRSARYWHLNTTIVYLLCALLLFAVLAYGGVEEWTIMVLELASGALFLLWAGQQLIARQLLLKSSVLYLPAFAFFLLILLQIVFHTTVYPYATIFSAMLYAVYGVVLLITANCLSGNNTRRHVAILLTIFAALYALYGVGQNLVSPVHFLWNQSAPSSLPVFATFVNRNHYAGLMEMLAPIPLVLVMGNLLRGAQRVLAGFAFVVIAGSIFLSTSRGGMVSLAGELVFFAIVTARRSPHRGASMRYVLLALAFFCFLFFASRGQISDRLRDLAPDVRGAVAKDTLRMWKDRPLLGWGLGNFTTVYPRYRSFYLDRFINAAHDDYLQVLSETGIAGLAAIAWFLVALYASGSRRIQHWRDSWGRALSMSALIGCTGLLLHGFLDFNFQIPANVMFFVFMAALATSESERVHHPG